MTIIALLSGSLHKDPETKTGKNGPFVCATLKHLDGGGHPQFARVVAFDQEARDELASLSKGDGLAVTGRLEAEIYSPEGEPPRVSVSLIADRVTPLRKTPRDTSAPTATKGKTYDRPRR